MQAFFDLLCDEDIISKDALDQFNTSQDQRQQEGKELSRLSVRQFSWYLR